VTAWLRGTQGVGEDTAWAVGQALRKLDARTNEIEALWAAGFFATLFRLLQQISHAPDGTGLAVRLFALLPARMLEFETSLCETIVDTQHGAQYLAGYHSLAAREWLNEDTAPLVEDHPVRRVAALCANAYADEHLRIYQHAWERVTLGDYGARAQHQPGDACRGDDDLVDVLCDMSDRMRDRWVPSLLIVRLWRMATEWANEVAPCDSSDFEIIPDIFLPEAAVRERDFYMDQYAEEAAFQYAYDTYRGK
jgi:hypothetical protein